MDDGRSMRAVKNNLPTPSGEVEESEGPRPGKWHVLGVRSNRGQGGENIASSGQVRTLRAVGIIPSPLIK